MASGGKPSSCAKASDSLRQLFLEFHHTFEQLSENESALFNCCNARQSVHEKRKSLNDLLTKRIHMTKDILYLLDKIQTEDPELKVARVAFIDEFQHSTQQLLLLHYEKQKYGYWGMEQDVYDEDILLENFTAELCELQAIDRTQLQKLLHQLMEALHNIVIKELQRKNSQVQKPKGHEEEESPTSHCTRTGVSEVILPEKDDGTLYTSMYGSKDMGSGASAKQKPHISSSYPPPPPYTQQRTASGEIPHHPLGVPRNDGSYQFQHTPGALPYPTQDHASFPTPQPVSKDVKSAPAENSSDEDEISKTTNAQGWSYEKDRIYMMVLSAEEFLGRMQETDQRIHTVSQACERELHRKTIEELLGLRGHLQDELLRIEQMLAKDDPKLKSLNSFEQNFPHVVAKLRELRRKEGIVQAKVIQEELPPSSQGTGSAETGSQATGTSSTSTGTQSGTVTGVGVGVQSSPVPTEEDLKKRHKEEEKKVAANYADRFVKNSELSPDDVERLLQDHALSMQALRKRQAGERDSMKERMRAKLRNKLQRENLSGITETGGTSTEAAVPQTVTKKDTFVNSEDEESSDPKSNGKENDKNNNLDSDDSDTGEMLANTMWNKMKLKHRMTAEHMQDMVKTFQADLRGTQSPRTPDSLVSKEAESGDELCEDTTKEDEEFVTQLIKKNRAKMTEEEFAVFLDEYLHDRDSLRRYNAQKKTALDAKLQRKLRAKQDAQGLEGYDSADGGYVEDFDADSQKSETGSATGSQEDFDPETLEELKELKADLQEQMGANRKDLSEEDVKQMLALYRRKQAEIIASRKASRQKHDDKLQEKLKQRKKKKQAKDSAKSQDQDDQFFQKLMMRQESGELSKEEFSEMLKDYIGKKKDEDRQKRRELRKRDSQVDKMAAFQMVDNFRKDKQELHNVRKAERSKIDDKLQKKLLSKKKNREQAGVTDSDISAHETNGDSFFNDSSHLNGTS